MDPQHAPVPYSATHADRSQQPHPLSPNTTPNEHEYTYNEKDASSRQQSRVDRGSKASSNGRAHDSVISHPFSPKQSYPPSPSSSISSAGGQRQSPTPEIQYSKSTNHGESIKVPAQAHLDPEKHGYRSSQDRPHRHSGTHDAVYDENKYHEKEPLEKAWQLLVSSLLSIYLRPSLIHVQFYLSGPCALLSVAITLWTAVALFVSLALAPLKFCTTRPSLSKQLTTFLVPALNLQLHLVYSHNASQEYSAPMLVVIHLLSPVVAFGVAIAAWTAAGFWFFSSILGDPGGHDGGRHNDGKECIIGVRNWWERWLSRGLR